MGSLMRVMACPLALEQTLTEKQSMDNPRTVSRRRLLRMSLAAGGLASSARMLAAAEPLRRTPTQILGPFYPVMKPLDQDADLTAIKGKSGKAAGQMLHVMGRVLNTRGEPVQGARIEIWQANTHGRYTHPSDRNTAPLDPNFEGFATLITDEQGRYRFKTVKPGAYPQDGEMRPPHIHFDVSGKINRLVTQMYFAGESLNERDRFLATARANASRLIVSLQPPTPGLEAESLVAQWDVVLEQG
jgi:protocatechuate 3,4-dioxygenase, beta subunit